MNSLIIGPDAREGVVRPWEILCLLGILVLQAIALHLYFVPTSGGTDANAYHVSSRMVQEHGRFHQMPEDELTFFGKMWVVNDRVTAELIAAFYAELARPGVSRAAALRRAQLATLGEAEFRHPVHWAPFLLISSWL